MMSTKVCMVINFGKIGEKMGIQFERRDWF